VGFPRNIKDEILVASARHCCVCHRYKGVKVEIHHIVQEANDGPNTFDNAIALCFDCHADAGHYNTLHPRGTKFSPDELRKAKNSWLEIVRENGIEIFNSRDELLCQYYVCKNYEILSEISKLNLTRFPVANPLICKNHILSSLVDLVNRHPSDRRSATLWGKKFLTEGEYLEIYQHPEELSKNGESYPYFRHVRAPDSEELIELSKKDGVVHAMLESGVEPGKGITVVGCYEAGCDGIKWQEEYMLRDLWCVFLLIENVSEKILRLKSLQCEISQLKGFSDFGILYEKGEIPLPAAPIKSGTSIIIPVAVVLPPINPIKIERYSTIPDYPAGDYYQALSHCSISKEDIKDILIYGGIIRPTKIIYSIQGTDFEQPIHSLDLSNFYEIDMQWGCGSCPHLFYVGDRVKYIRELLPLCENHIGEDSFTIPEGVHKIIIAELEDEISELESIRIDGQVVLSEFKLEKGEKIELAVSSGQHIEVFGKYIPHLYTERNMPTGRVRNTIIHEFMAEKYNTWHAVAHALRS
jgi:hypothetical protein